MSFSSNLPDVSGPAPAIGAGLFEIYTAICRKIRHREENVLNIRNMKPEDYDEVYALWLSCPGMGLNNLDDSREGIAQYLARNRALAELIRIDT